MNIFKSRIKITILFKSGVSRTYKILNTPDSEKTILNVRKIVRDGMRDNSNAVIYIGYSSIRVSDISAIEIKT